MTYNILKNKNYHNKIEDLSFRYFFHLHGVKYFYNYYITFTLFTFNIHCNRKQRLISFTVHHANKRIMFYFPSAFPLTLFAVKR